MTVHNYRSRQVHETLNGVNPSSGFRDMRSAKSGSDLWQIWQVFGPWASPYGANGQMTVHNYRPRQFHRTSNGENPSSGYRDMGSASLAAARPTARPPARLPGPWRQYPSSPEGWGVKRPSFPYHDIIKWYWSDEFIICMLTYWGQLVHIICINNLAHHGSDNGLAPILHQDITWINIGLLSIGTFGTNVSEIWIKYNIIHSRKSISIF